MFATWILCLFLLMIAPYLTVEAGLLRRKKCAALGAGRGYRTQLSMASQEAWDFAQQLCSKRYILGGIVMGIAALLLIKPRRSSLSSACMCSPSSSACLRWLRSSCSLRRWRPACASVMRRRPPPDLPFSSFLSP